MSDPDSFYYSFVINNTSPINQIASGQDTRQDIMIQNTEKYNVSIIRFTTDTSFPLFLPVYTVIPQPPPNPPIYQSNMSLTFGYNGTNYQQFINITAQEAKSGVFNIGQFLVDVNAASAACYASLVAGSPFTTAKIAPYFSFDPDTQLISMFVDVGWLDTNSPPTVMYFNQQLQSLLNLPAVQYKPPPNPLGIDYQITLKNYAKLVPDVNTRFGFPYFINNINFTLVQIEQEFIQTNNFSDIDKVQFSSRAIPVTSQLSSPNSSAGSGISDNFQPILTDFSVGGSFDRSGYLEYLPTAEYRRLPMKRGDPLSRIDLSVTYSTYDGSIHPLILPPGGKTTVLFFFERK